MAQRYLVVAQRQTTDLTPDGRFGDVMEVTFEVLSTGTIGNVRVPLTQYSAERVAELVDAYVDRIEAVAGL